MLGHTQSHSYLHHRTVVKRGLPEPSLGDVCYHGNSVQRVMVLYCLGNRKSSICVQNRCNHHRPGFIFYLSLVEGTDADTKSAGLRISWFNSLSHIITAIPTWHLREMRGPEQLIVHHSWTGANLRLRPKFPVWSFKVALLFFAKVLWRFKS